MIGTAKGLARMVHRRLLELRLLGRFMLRLRTYQPRRVIKKMTGTGWMQMNLVDSPQKP